MTSRSADISFFRYGWTIVAVCLFVLGGCTMSLQEQPELDPERAVRLPLAAAMDRLTALPNDYPGDMACYFSVDAVRNKDGGEIEYDEIGIKNIEEQNEKVMIELQERGFLETMSNPFHYYLAFWYWPFFAIHDTALTDSCYLSIAAGRRQELFTALYAVEISHSAA